MAFLFLALNFLIISLRGIIPENIVFVLPHVLAVWAYIKIKRGLISFYDIKKYRFFTDFTILILLIIALIINETNAKLRIITVCTASILVYLDIIILFTSKEVKGKTKSHVIPILFSMAIVIMISRISLGLQWSVDINPLETKNNLSTISILYFLNNIVIFFALLFIVLDKKNKEKDELIEKIKSISLTDELTGLMNRRGFKQVTNYELNRFARTSRGFTFVICDIDHFKSVNDQFGHHCGDMVIKKIGDILQKNIRNSDTIARWGGEEFVLFLPETNKEESQGVLERMKLEIEENSFEYNDEIFSKTMSFGACFCNSSEIEINQIVEKADSNLYMAKEQGRNKIITSVY